MKRKIYQDNIGQYIKHEGYIWRPEGPDSPRWEPGTLVECSATFGGHGPGIMTFKGLHSLGDSWVVRWLPRLGHEIAPGRFEGDAS